MSNPMAASTLLQLNATRPAMRRCGIARRTMAGRSARQVVSAAAPRPGQEGWAAAGPSGLLKLACAVAGSGLLLAGPAHADKVAEFATSGFLFKDMAEVVAIEDKEAPGVLLYLTDVNRSITEKARQGAGGHTGPPSSAPTAVHTIPQSSAYACPPSLGTAAEQGLLWGSEPGFADLRGSGARHPQRPGGGPWEGG